MTTLHYVSTDLAAAIRHFELCQLASRSLSAEDQITLIRKKSGGLLLEALHPDLTFKIYWENSELSELTLNPQYEYQVETALVVQLLKGFSKEIPLELGVSREGLHLRNGENLSIVPWLAYTKTTESELVPSGEEDLEKPSGEIVLSFASKQLTRLKALLKSIPKEAVSTALLALQIRYREDEPLVCTVGNGVYFAEWQGSVQSGRGQGLLHLEEGHAELLVACLERANPLTLQIYPQFLSLKTETLEAQIPLRDKAFPNLRRFQTIQGSQSFQGEAKQFDQALKGLLPLSDDVLPELEIVRQQDDVLTFRLYQGDASQGTVEVTGPLQNFRLLVRSDFLKEIKRLLKGKIWTWTLLETDPEILRVEDDQVRFWFRPMLDPRSEKYIVKMERDQRKMEALEEAELVEPDYTGPLVELL